MKKIALITIVVVLFAVLVFVVARNSPQTLQTSSISNETLPISATIITPTREKISVRIADDTNERQLGLSYFKSLPPDQGMLFLFDKLGNYPFWMKDMNFAIDIIWLKRVSLNSFEVVYVAPNIDPSTYPQTIDPKREADAVLEVGVGRAKNFGIVEGVLLKM